MKKRSFTLKKHCKRQVYEKSKKRILSGAAFITLIFLFTSVSAQEAVNSSGGNGSGSGGSVSYSIGTTVYTANSGTEGSVSQGVQNPYEIFVVTGIDDEKGVDLMLSAYPNPVSDYLILKVESDKLEKSRYQLYNLEGKLLEDKKISSSETNIEMSSLKPDTYLLKVIINNKESKTFKIIKN